MNLRTLLVASLVLLCARGAGLSAATINDVYLLGPDSAAQPGVPQGKVTDWETLPSEAYPGTLHDFCVYVPAQYNPASAASLMIFQDGQAWLRPTGDLRAANVFDNLIYRREIPVTIVVFINPGRTQTSRSRRPRNGATAHRTAPRSTTPSMTSTPR